jgi:hypothetical protein
VVVELGVHTVVPSSRCHYGGHRTGCGCKLTAPSCIVHQVNARRQQLEDQLAAGLAPCEKAPVMYELRGLRLLELQKMLRAQVSRGTVLCCAPPCELVASPSELLASPSKLLASPSELLASPSKLLASPSELLASPSELVASPSELVAHAASVR